jgi:hypothetical protein
MAYMEHGGLPSTHLYTNLLQVGHRLISLIRRLSMITSTVKEPSKEKVVATFQFLEHLGGRLC